MPGKIDFLLLLKLHPMKLNRGIYDEHGYWLLFSIVFFPVDFRPSSLLPGLALLP